MEQQSLSNEENIMANTPEGKTKEEIREWLEKEFDNPYVFMPVQTMYGVHGTPDFLCCLPVVITQEMVGTTVGMFAGIEAKDFGKDAKPLQRIQIGLIKDAKGVAGVARGRGQTLIDCLLMMKRMLVSKRV